MDKVRGAIVLVLVLALMSTSNVNGDGGDEDKGKKASFWEWRRLRNAYSIYSAAFSPTTIARFVKELLKQAYAHFFSPNIDFRRGDEGGGAVTTAENGGAGEKVKEALAKSIGTSKATLEDTAKSAADIAGETMHKVVKGTIQEDRETKRQSEL